MAILPDLTQASREELLGLIESLKRQSTQRITLKVTDKGAMSVYGLGRFPVTLYASQWDRLLDATTVETLRTFIKTNAASLTRKD